jgi:gluconolactonase
VSLRVETFFDGLLTEPRLDHPEGIAVHPDGSVWCGGERGQIYRIADGRIEQVASTGGFCLGLAFDSTGDLYVCDLVHAAVLRMDARTGVVSPFADGVPGQRIIGPNFVAVDSQDRVYVSDNGHAHQPGGGIFRFGRDGTGEVWHPGPFDFANGMALDADERTLYLAETWGRRVVAVAIDTEGDAGAMRTVVELPGMLPDGLAFDYEGRLYVGCYEPSRVLVVDPDRGTWSILAEDPDAHALCHPTNLAFRGHDLLTANLGRWHISQISVGRQGLPLAPFRRG